MLHVASLILHVSAKAGTGSQRMWQLAVSDLEMFLANDSHSPPHE